jgi:hypothetical protein
MATVAAPTPARKAPRAYHAILDETHGTLTQLDGTLVFMSDEGTLTEVEPTQLNFLVVLGEIGLADAARLLDALHGGPAWIATHRAQEVA